MIIRNTGNAENQIYIMCFKTRGQGQLCRRALNCGRYMGDKNYQIDIREVLSRKYAGGYAKQECFERGAAAPLGGTAGGWLLLGLSQNTGGLYVPVFTGGSKGCFPGRPEAVENIIYQRQRPDKDRQGCIFRMCVSGEDFAAWDGDGGG